MRPCIRSQKVRFLLVSGLAVFTGATATQTSGEPAAAPPSLPYQSVFDGYRSFRDEPVQSWREVNDLTGRIGGWRAYAKEMQAGESEREPPATDSPTGRGGVEP